MRQIVAAIILFGLAPTAKADALDIFLNNNVVSVDYLTTFRGADVDLGLLFNARSDWVVSAGLLVLGREYGAASKVEGGFGAKAYLASVGGTSVTALAIGGQLIYFPRSSKFGIGGYLYYAPDIVTFSGTSFLEYGARAEYQLMDTASAYVGIHWVSADTGAGAVTIDDGLHLGISIRF